MGYVVKLVEAVVPGSAGAPDPQETQSCGSILEAAEHAERMAEPAGNSAAIFDDSTESGEGSEVARYSAASGWSSGTLTPAAWWAKLSMPAKEKLRADPHGEIDTGVWQEVAEAGGVFLGVARPETAGAATFRLPQRLADFVDSEQPKL